MEFLDIAGIEGLLPIAIIVWAICFCVKRFTPIDNAHIPAIAVILGLILGVVANIVGILNLGDLDIYSACATGIISGLGSVGINSLVHEYIKKYQAKNANTSVDTSK